MIDREHKSPAAWWDACQKSLARSQDRRGHNWRWYLEMLALVLLVVGAFIALAWTGAQILSGGAYAA